MDVSKISKRRIDSLQALRALAFLGIFFMHAKFFVNWSGLGVSIFFVMSGFLMTYTYEDRAFNLSVKDNYKFALGKIKKLYPLHIITMICVAIPHLATIIYNGINIKALAKLAAEIVLNVTLLQTWIPHRSVNVSLNGTAWYLSATLFLYFIFPYLLKFVKRSSKTKLSIMSALILVIETLLCIPFIKILGTDSPVYIWFSYFFPVFRLGDFFVGCALSRIYIYNGNLFGSGKIKATILEALATAITIMVFLWIKQEPTNVVLSAIQNGTTVFIPLAAMWVLLFSVNKGYITRILSNKLFIYIGDISPYAFLIHFVITTNANSLLGFLNIELFGIRKTVLVFAELLLSIALSAVYKHFHEKYQKHKATKINNNN